MASIQILSDLHLESPKAYDVFKIEPKAPYLALVGDIGQAGQESHVDEMLAFLTYHLRLFRAIFFVAGNHEAYGSTWPQTLANLRDFETDIASKRATDPTLGAFVLMNRATFRIPETIATAASSTSTTSTSTPDSTPTPTSQPDESAILVLGCSLFSHVPEKHSMTVEMRLNDFHKTGDGWDVASHNYAHELDVAWLNEQVARAEQDQTIKGVVILTHWSPSVDERAVEPRHAGSDISSAFSTDLSQEVCWSGSKVRAWVCGHTHYNYDFWAERGVGKAPLRLVTNQRGYYFQQAAGYDGEKTVMIPYTEPKVLFHAPTSHQALKSPTLKTHNFLRKCYKLIR